MIKIKSQAVCGGLLAVCLFAALIAPAALARTKKARGRHQRLNYSRKLRANPSAWLATDSINWSGYVSTRGPFDEISGTWKIPKVKHSSEISADATWIGIGGVLSNDLIQSGTEADAGPRGKINYQAWIELLPDPPFSIPVSVSAGDSVSVRIQKSGAKKWRVDFGNETTGRKYSTEEHYKSSLSSAEWIEEAPSTASGVMPMDKFGSVHFKNAYAERRGIRETLEQAGALPVNLIDSLGEILAQTSKLTKKGSSFAVRRSKITSGPQDMPLFFSAARRIGSIFKKR